MPKATFPNSPPACVSPLTDHDTDSLNRDWQAIEVKHYGEQPQALEEDGITQGDAAGMTRYHNQVTLIPGDTPWRATPNPKPRVDGIPKSPFVVGPEGEEIHCDEYGRVKVQFPWDRYAEPNDTASCWVRVAQGWAGGGYGSIAIPRIGHEVIVSFLEGDLDQPLVTGRTYHAVNTAPTRCQSTKPERCCAPRATRAKASTNYALKTKRVRSKSGSTPRKTWNC
ncbi:hypothetical protein HORIV_48800 [Vreelandella olivaria]|uniref:Gp5/Type VI secretion system Vgr protein OB-fold domain-containing protein n=1 Tax=Vreelandella olivaria TaxID=390919 RepID=A0ABM7GN56_9GAMM|nr:hypothetical protein HORIV_48800 [Halomonas olivaria]